ncbi:MAG: response regulator transcription factor [Bryobacteraceae bacterium]
MIRVGIITDNNTRGRALAQLLEDEDRIDAVVLNAFARDGRETQLLYLHVVIATSATVASSLPADGPPVLVLADESETEPSFREPIRGWLTSNPTASELSAAIAALAQNLVVLTETGAKRRFGAPRQNEEHEVASESLTPRELQVLRMLADGLGNKEIATRLKISEHTSKFHVAQILAKLGAGSRAEAVALGIRRGLVPI